MKRKINYISFDEFVNNSGMKEKTVIRNWKRIPGITKTEQGFQVMSGTRYPCDLHRYKLNDSGEKRYALLKAISQYKYITHVDLKIEQLQFLDMLRDLLAAKLIQRNHLSNSYGANAYDCSPLGDQLIKKTDKAAKKELLELISAAAGTFSGAVISQVYEIS